MTNPTLAIPHYVWQVLRAVARANGKPVIGHELRLNMARRTKDGSFLTRLVDAGLLAREMPLVSDERDAKKSLPFRYTYTLTEKGARAAEYGECEQEIGKLIK